VFHQPLDAVARLLCCLDAWQAELRKQVVENVALSCSDGGDQLVAIFVLRSAMYLVEQPVLGAAQISGDGLELLGLHVVLLRNETATPPVQGDAADGDHSAASMIGAVRKSSASATRSGPALAMKRMMSASVIALGAMPSSARTLSARV